LVQASNFTSYATGGFGLTDQHELARRAAQVAKKRDIPVLISNHDTELTRALYKQADISSLSVSRSISQKGDGRKPVTELLALYNTDSAASNVVSINKKLKKVGT
jgi:DNA adenine methylase